MAMEPITIYTRRLDLAQLAAELRMNFPGLKLDGPDDRWTEAVITTGGLFRKRRLTLRYSPEYCAEPNWSMQMQGMRNYLANFPDTDRKERAMMLPTTFRASLATEFTPECDPNGDTRLGVVLAITESLDGVLFTPSSLRDYHGEILFSAAGAAAESDDAVWPKVIASVDISGSDSDGDDEEDDEFKPDPPSGERVARRALALTAVTARAIMEQGANQANVQEDYQSLLAWIEQVGFGDELEPDEWAVIQRPIGKLDQRSQIDSTWRLESLGVLAWALQRFEIPPHDQLVDANLLWNSLGFLDSEAAHALLANPNLRQPEEIERLGRRLLGLHWRLRNFGLDHQAMDFAKLARNFWAGPLDITGIALAGGDLSLGGVPISKASRDAVSTANSAAMERHMAINWLRRGGEKYSDTDTST